MGAKHLYAIEVIANPYPDSGMTYKIARWVHMADPRVQSANQVKLIGPIEASGRTEALAIALSIAQFPERLVTSRSSEPARQHDTWRAFFNNEP